MKCPRCFKWIHKKASKCPFCQSIIRESDETYDEYYGYLTNGFNYVERQCIDFDDAIDDMTAGVFYRHTYTKEELLNSKYIDVIESTLGKMRNDIQNWINANKIPIQFQTIFEARASVVDTRISHMRDRISKRQQTFWEIILQGFMGVYQIVFQMVLNKFNDFILRKNTTDGGVKNTF